MFVFAICRSLLSWAALVKWLRAGTGTRKVLMRIVPWQQELNTQSAFPRTRRRDRRRWAADDSITARGRPCGTFGVSHAACSHNLVAANTPSPPLASPTNLFKNRYFFFLFVVERFRLTQR